MDSLRVLVIEDSEADTKLLLRELKKGGFEPVFKRVDTPETVRNALREQQWDAVVSDYKMPAFDGLDALRIVQQSGLDIPFILISGQIDEETAVGAMKAGAHDYITKGKLGRLIPAIRRELKEVEVRRERRRIEKELQEYHNSLERIIEERTSQWKTANEQLLLEVEERRRTESELKRSNEDLQQFAYIASHDLQSPLRTVEGFVKLLARKYQGRADAKAEEIIGYVLTSLGNMQSLIGNLLDFSRVGRGGNGFDFVDIAKCVMTAIDNLRAAIEEKKARIIYEEKFPPVFGDITQLTSLFQNLVGNALKFSREDPLIRIAVQKEENHYLFSVKDNGIGIEPENLQKIFGAFQRVHGKSEYPGTGLGLAICKRIVEYHGGRIWANSKPGKGSTFFFTLPRSNNGEEGAINMDLQKGP